MNISPSLLHFVTQSICIPTKYFCFQREHFSLTASLRDSVSMYTNEVLSFPACELPGHSHVSSLFIIKEQKHVGCFCIEFSSIFDSIVECFGVMFIYVPVVLCHWRGKRQISLRRYSKVVLWDIGYFCHTCRPRSWRHWCKLLGTKWHLSRSRFCDFQMSICRWTTKRVFFF